MFLGSGSEALPKIAWIKCRELVGHGGQVRWRCRRGIKRIELDQTRPRPGFLRRRGRKSREPRCGGRRTAGPQETLRSPNLKLRGVFEKSLNLLEELCFRLGGIVPVQ